MEHIKNIEIKNFKSIRYAEIKDCRRINVFIGYPNVGKSNILEALGLFSIDDPSIPFSSFVRMENLTTVFFDGNIQEIIEVKLNHNHRYIAKIENDSLKFERQYASDATIFENEGLDFITSLNDSSVTLKQSFELKEGNSSILNFKSPNYTEIKFGHLISEILKYEFKKNHILNETGYTSLQHPYGNNMFSILDTNVSLKKDATEILSQYGLELLYDSRNRNFTILKRTKRGIFTVPYELLADTIQRLLFYKAAILSNNGNILLLEEPEAHMFPPYISKFTSDIIYGENENQYFIATHSPFVLNDFMEDMEKDDLAIFTVGYKKDSGETIVRKLSDDEIQEVYQYGIDLFFNLESYLLNEV